MIDLKTGKDMNSDNHFDYVRQLEVITEELPYGIKQYKEQVAELVSMDKRLSALQEKADRNASVRLADKIDSLASQYVAAYNRCASALSVINDEIEKANVLFVKLSDYYASVGNVKAARRVRKSLDKFEKDNAKSLDAPVEAMNSISCIEYVKSMQKESLAEPVSGAGDAEIPRGESAPERREPVNNSVREGEPRRESGIGAPPPPPPRHANPYHDPYRMPPYYYQPMPSFNIAPISIDVNRAVESAVDSFISAFEERVGKYIDKRLSQVTESSLPIDSEPSPSSIDPAEAEAVEKVAEDEAFALDKLISILEGMKSLMAGIGELNEVYTALEEKQKLAIESAKALSDAQRSLAREIQGIQATQKVISVDQQATAEEQAHILENQKATLSGQSELREKQAELAASQLEAIKKHGELGESISAVNEALAKLSNDEEERLKASAKAVEMQRNLGEKQTELIELQREALLAQKKLTRSQRAFNERVGAKTNSSESDNSPIE